MTLEPIEKILPAEKDTLREVIRFLADIALRLSHDGFVLTAFARADHPAETLVQSWINGDFRDTLTAESKPKFDRALSGVLSGPERPQEIEVNHRIGEAFGVPVKYSVHRQDGGRTVLLVGRDRSEVATAQQKLMAAQVETEKAGQRSRHVVTTLLAAFNAVRDPMFVVNEDTGEVEETNAEANVLLGRDAARGRFLFETAGWIEGDSLFLRSDAQRPLRIETVRYRRGPSHMMIVVAYGVTDDTAPASFEDSLNDAAIALAITDADGRLEFSNSALSDLTSTGGTTTRPLVGRSVADLLERGTTDLHLVLVSVLAGGSIADYETALIAGGARVPVAVAAFRFGKNSTPHILWMFRMSHGRSTRSEPSLVLADMVGQIPLSEIVEQSTVEIERQCIVEALRQTGNNRAAAANLLGLSRQGLYVKLRRFGIESKS